MIELEEWTIRRDFLRKALARLTPRREGIICAMLEGVPITGISRHYDISSTRVRQIAKKISLAMAEFWEDESAWNNVKPPAKKYRKEDGRFWPECAERSRSEPKPKYDKNGYVYFDGAHHIRVTNTAKPESHPEAWRLFWDDKIKMTYWLNTVTNETAFWGGEAKPPK